jgi:hypothetical protein
MSSTHRHLLLDFFWQVISGPPCIRRPTRHWETLSFIKLTLHYKMHYSLFFPGRRVRAHLQNPATKCDFPIGYFIFLLTLEKCAILQCSVMSIRSKLPFLFHSVLLFRSCFVSVLFLFRVCFLLCPFIY